MREAGLEPANAQITLPAETLPQAVGLACAVVTAAARAAGVHADPVAVEAMAEAEFDIREGFEDDPAQGEPTPAAARRRTCDG